MNLEKLGVCETRKVSVDELLREKPDQLPFLNTVMNEPNNYTLDINRVTVHDVRSHKIIYGSSYVIIRFFNRNNVLLANLSAFGSSEDGKSDENFHISLGSIVSETSVRVMNGDLSRT